MAQYFNNAYFPQITPEESIPVEAKILAAAATVPAAKSIQIPLKDKSGSSPEMTIPYRVPLAVRSGFYRSPT